MYQEAKLITCQVSQNEQRRFTIYNNQIFGSGAFGTVKRAHQQNLQSIQLAAKIVPYGDEASKEKINKQVQIIKQLPDHPNLVKVLPLKCFSEKNFYIFMEYCNEGTLQSKMKEKVKNKQTFTQEQIFQAFYQVLDGYKVLWKKKILHQDLKPDNILIKNGVYKITDFGFSIFHQNVQMTRQRQGTFPYMPLQKLTLVNYYASTKSDVYSLGVIFFKMIAGRHPYVITQFQSYKQFIQMLKTSQLAVPSYLRSRMSPPMQHLFDLILRMIAKKQKERADFDEIYQFIEQQQEFLKFTQLKQKQNQAISQEVQIKKEKNIHFVQCSSAFAIPFSIPTHQQEQYLKNLINQKTISNQKKQIQTFQKIERYLCSMRLMVYFFDRLNRKLIVQKMKKQQKGSNSDAQIQQKTILGLLYLSTKITTQTLQQSRYHRVFSVQQWKIYKRNQHYMLKLIKNDQDYLKCLINDTIMSTKQSKIADRHQIIDKSKKSLNQFMREQIRVRLFQLLDTRKSWISVDDRKGLTTLNYILTAIEIIDNFQQKKQEWQALESYFRQVQVQQINQLFAKVTKGLRIYGVSYSIDEGDWQEEQK